MAGTVENKSGGQQATTSDTRTKSYSTSDRERPSGDVRGSPARRRQLTVRARETVVAFLAGGASW